MVSLFDGISNFLGYLMQIYIIEKELQWFYLIPSYGDKGFHIPPKGITPKVKIIARLEFEIAYFKVAVHHFNRYVTWTSPTREIEEIRIKYFYQKEEWGLVWLKLSKYQKEFLVNVGIYLILLLEREIDWKSLFQKLSLLTKWIFCLRSFIYFW